MGEPGRRCLGGRYELICLLATGGMGQVWRGHDTRLDRPVAVKVLRSEYAGHPTFVARFRAEARHTAVLAHRNIAALHDYGEAGAGESGQEHLAYLVMELVEGEALSDVLAREGRLSVERTLDMLQQTAAALAAAHAAGVVHRDVKPGNILVGADGIVKITDFGIAWSASSVPLTQTGQVVGTAHYLSPEQAAGSKAGPASDVYALGMIGYECLAGRRAFDGENSVQIALRQLRDIPDPLPDDVPENVRRLIGSALLKDPETRFPDGAAFRDAVADVLAGRMLTPPPRESGTRQFPLVGVTGAVPRRRRAGRLLVPAVALLAGAGIAVAGLQLLATPSTPTPVAAAEEPGPTSVVLAADHFVGRPVAEVEAELGALGLGVERVSQESSTQAPGLVTAVSPTGSVPEGSRVTVSYAVAPAVAPSAPEAPVPVPASAPWPAVSESAGGFPPAGDVGDGASVGKPDGNGNAGGNGKGLGQGKANGRPKGG